MCRIKLVVIYWDIKENSQIAMQELTEINCEQVFETSEKVVIFNLCK